MGRGRKAPLCKGTSCPPLLGKEKALTMLFRGEMSKRISPAFAVTEGKVHLALPENCPYKVDFRFE